ncbi:MAG: HopJ type III effector protein [Cycloclasticus sp.]|jgi:hypothetical protein|nr:HopJ type III effector protein [Cycloclasticus sp.]MEE4291198.1 HopJ type III effector protein [Cycloclasticus sp.]
MNRIEAIKNNPSINVETVIELIDALYDYHPVDFKNGDVSNKAGTNDITCKLFAFAKLNEFTQEQTLACFGHYYQDVLNTPDADDHQNIRNFMQHGWGGVSFSGTALTEK